MEPEPGGHGGPPLQKAMKIIRNDEHRAFAEHLAARAVALDAELMKLVTSIVDDVRVRGDEVLIDYTAKFENVDLKQTDLRVTEEELRRSAHGVDKRVLVALHEAIANVRTFHQL